MKGAAWLIALLCAAIFGAVYTKQQREYGALRAITQDDVRVAKLERLRGDSLERVFRVDTVRLYRKIAIVDTLLRTRIDSAIIQHTDTVTLTLREVAQIDTAIKACRETVLTCGELNAAKSRQIEALNAEIRAMQKAKPSAFGNAVRYGLALGVGVLAGKAGIP